MGKVIARNIKGMSWKAKSSLIMVLTVLATFAMYGWFGMKRTEAAINQLVAWTNVYHSATAMSGAGSSFAVAAGKNRMLVVGVSVSLTGAAAQTTGTVTYGGTAMTLALGDAATSARAHTYLYYLPLGDATVADASKALAVTITGGTSRVNDIYYAVYTGVDQSAPITNSRNYNSGASTVAANGTFAFATALTINANNQAILVYSQDNTTTTTAPGLTLTTGFTQGATNTWTTTSGAKATTAYQTTKPTTNTTSTCSSTNTGVASYVSMTGISLKPATTTLGDGVVGSTGPVAPGALAQKIDGFSFATSAAGTTDSVTGLTVTTTNFAAIDSMEIWDEAQSTKYFATVTNPGTNTWTFSGGTPIPVTSSVANYKILINFKTRTNGLPGGNTAVTANVTAFTSGNGNITAGTDTADTTLTVQNTHAASLWGTNTAGDAQITLNWSNGTAGQKVVIIRYNTNTDTTKPADGSTYKVGDPFGAGGTVRFVGTTGTETTTIDNVNVQNKSTYYYKIFEFDSYNNYYNASDNWTGPLNPVSSDSTAPTVNAGFAANSTVNTTAIPITSFGATDNPGGKGVAGYMITTSATAPAFNDPGWKATPPTSFTVAGPGSYTLYPWALDGGYNVSAVYAAPVTVLVDQTAPAIVSFSAPAQVANNRNIPITAFSATDAGGANGVQYLITTTSAQPSAGAAGWSSTAPTSYGVGADGSYTLYPWAKDAAGNVTAVYGSPVSVLVDITGPTVPAPISPADMATGQLVTTQLSVNPATDSGVGGVQYWFEVTNVEIGYSVNSGWTNSTTFSPGGLTNGVSYTWRVQAKDALGNPSGFSTPRTFTTAQACVRNAPTITLLTGTGSVAQTITTDGGTANYNLSVTNNDYGGCGDTPFTFTVTDNDSENKFDPPTVAPAAVTLAPGQSTVANVAVKATPGIIGGVDRTHVTSADPYHATVTTGDVITTINVSGCYPHTPRLTIGPNTGYADRGGVHNYTVTVANTDTGASCAPVTFNLSIPGESNSTDFNASTLSGTVLTLDSGESASVTLRVSAKSTAAQKAVNTTSVAVVASGHTAPPNNSAVTTVNNPLLHNSDSTGSSKWSSVGGWGLPGAKYGEFDCATCHVQGGITTKNIKRVRETITTPDPAKGTIPGDGQPVVFNRTVGTTASGVLGWDAGATPRTSSTNVCQVCHTYDATGANGVKARPYATTATLGSHYQTDGKDCIRCHKHNKGFGLSGLNCTFCHGTPTSGTIDGTNRYVVAPPQSVAGNTGLATGVGQVSSDPKVGAHQTHLRTFNGFTNYSTVDFRCQNCHGPLPTDYAHGTVAGSATPAFQGMATRGGMSPSFNATNRTCSNTYCHNPAGSGILLATNVGSNVFPSWTSARYVSSGAKSVANCSVCHKVPGVAGFEPASVHAGMSADTTDCSGCHGHNGDSSGTVAGRRHMDGIMYANGNCNTCHGYDTTDGGTTWTPALGGGSGAGAHVKHINFIKSRLGIAALNPANQTFGTGEPAAICGTCHTDTSTQHKDGQRAIIFGAGGTANTMGAGYAGSMSLLFGASNPSFDTTAKTCSNVSCHFSTTPSWY